jgi:diamine N-acetyltransferase
VAAAVELRPITAENVSAVCRLEVRPEQDKLVAPAAVTIAEGAYEPACETLAIYAGEDPVGVVMLEEEDGRHYIVRFMVAASRQGEGIGRRAVEAVVALVRDRGIDELSTSYVPAEDGAAGFWRAMGFEETGEVEDGEPIAARRLGPA